MGNFLFPPPLIIQRFTYESSLVIKCGALLFMHFFLSFLFARCIVFLREGVPWFVMSMCFPSVRPVSLTPSPTRRALVKTVSNWVVWGRERGWVMLGARYVLAPEGPFRRLENYRVLMPSPRLPTKGTYNKCREITASAV